MAEETRKRRSSVFKWALLGGIVLVVVGIGATTRILISRWVTPYLHQRAEDMLSSRFQSQVEIGDLDVKLFPELALHGSGIVLRHHGRTDVPPLLVIRDFSASAGLLSLFDKPWHLHRVKVTGLKITFPPREEREKMQGFSARKDVKVKIDELIADDSQLTLLSSKAGKPPHEFVIHHLSMKNIAPGQPAKFVAELTNAAPPGEIESKGEFGPWQAGNPRATPVNASYTFRDADLSVFKGISGILSSEGKFGGPLENLEVVGETTTPDFTVKSGDHPMMLKTEFSATVDGTNGDTLLHPVRAHFLGSTLVCNGSIVKAASGNGREILLDVSADDAKVQDLLLLAVKNDQPLLTGVIDLHTKFDLPPGPGDVADRLRLQGKFAIDDARFTSSKVTAKIKDLSRHGEGHPDDPEAGDAVSQLRGQFGLQETVLSFSRLGFRVRGANVQLHGSYGLKQETLDFQGNLRLQAKPSQMVTGFKSLLLKPFDGLFRKNGMTQFPIKVTGSRDHPSFGLNFGHGDDSDKEQKQDRPKVDKN